MDRNTLRNSVLATRDALSTKERGEKSLAIAKAVFSLEEYLSSHTVFVYASFRSEVSTEELIRHSLALGKTVSVPLTITQNHQLKPFRIYDPARDLVSGYWGIPEPDFSILQQINPEEIDLIILPGSVFDYQGSRLGYGGGYYDRFISMQAPRAIRMGLAFEEQVVSSVPVEDHDQPVHILVTDKKCVHLFK